MNALVARKAKSNLSFLLICRGLATVKCVCWLPIE
jgi:hypothetical protein